MLRRSPALARLFLPGSRLSNPFATVELPVAKKYVGKPHPTFFKFREKEAGFVLERDAHLKQRVRLTLETDVVNDYFRRSAKPGRIRVVGKLNDEDPAVLDQNTNLYDGLAHVNIGLPEDTKADDSLRVWISVNDETLVQPFVNEAVLKVAPAMSPSAGGKSNGRKKKPPKDDEGEVEKQPAGISIPEPQEVYHDKWDAYETFKMDGASAMRVVQAQATEGNGEAPSIGAYDLYVNMDNDFVRAEQKSHAREAELIGHRYKFGMTLAAVAAIRYAGLMPKSKRDDEDGEGHELSVEELVEATTDALSARAATHD